MEEAEKKPGVRRIENTDSFNGCVFDLLVEVSAAAIGCVH